jgi:hypothetical protein
LEKNTSNIIDKMQVNSPPVTDENVYLKLTHEPLFVGSFIKIPVIIKSQSGYNFDDLDFDIPDGPAGGIISLSRDKEFDINKPDIAGCRL